MKRVFFRVRRIYFDQIVSGEKKYEIRAHIDFWKKRLLWPKEPPPEVAVFWCGKDKHSRRIEDRILVPKKLLRRYLGREPSEQGVKDLQLDTHDYVIVTELGEVVE